MPTKLNFTVVEDIPWKKTIVRRMKGSDGAINTDKIIVTDTKVDFAYPLFRESELYSNTSKHSFSMSKTI